MKVRSKTRTKYIFSPFLSNALYDNTFSNVNNKYYFWEEDWFRILKYLAITKNIEISIDPLIYLQAVFENNNDILSYQLEPRIFLTKQPNVKLQ